MSAEPENIDDPTWAENDIATIPPVIAFASDMNKFAHQVTDSIRYLRETSLMVSDFRAANSGFPTNSVLLGLGLRWQPGVGFNKATQGDIFLCNGKRLDLFTQSILNIAGITNHTFPPNTRVWVYASGTYLDRISQVGGQGTTLPAAPPLSVDLYFHDVGAGNPPVVPAGYFIVGGVNTNGTGIVSNIDFSTFPAPFNLQSGIVFDAINFYINGTLEIGSSLIVQGSATFSDEVNITSDLNVQGQTHLLGDLIVDGLGTFNSGIDVAGTGFFQNNVVVDNSLVVNNELGVNGNTNLNGGLEVFGTSFFNAAVTMFSPLTVSGLATFNGLADFNDNVTITATGTTLNVSGGTIGIQTSGTSRGLTATSTTAGQVGISGTNTGGLFSTGVQGTGFTFGTLGVATDVAGFGLSGNSAAGAGTSGGGVLGVAQSNGEAGRFSSANGYGVHILTSGIIRPALRIDAQAANPTTLTTGDMWWLSDGPRFRLGTDNRMFWGTPEGMQMAERVTSTVTDLIPGSSDDVVISSFTVPAGSSVLVVAKVHIRFSGTQSATMQLRKDFVNVLPVAEIVESLAAGATFFNTTWTVTDIITGPVNAAVSVFASVGGGLNNVRFQGCQITVLGTFKTSDVTTA